MPADFKFTTITIAESLKYGDEDTPIISGTLVNNGTEAAVVLVGIMFPDIDEQRAYAVQSDQPIPPQGTVQFSMKIGKSTWSSEFFPKSGIHKIYAITGYESPPGTIVATDLSESNITIEGGIPTWVWYAVIGGVGLGLVYYLTRKPKQEYAQYPQ